MWHWRRRHVESPSPDRTVVERLITAQHHRGPDGCGLWSDEMAALAHNRLSIIDLELGQQPMLSGDGR